MYKQSIYNIMCKNFENETVMINTFSGNILRISGKKTPMFESVIRDINNCKNKKIIDYLSKNGFIVPMDVDEGHMAKISYKEKISDNKKLILTIMLR